MWNGTVLSDISEEVVGLQVQAFLLDGGNQFFIVVSSHGTTDNFSDVRNQDIDGFSDSSVVFTLLHVERLDFDWETDQQDWETNNVGHLTFSSFGNVVTELELFTIFVRNVVFVQPFQSIDVFHALEWELWSFKVRVQLLDERTSNWVFKNILDRLGDKTFQVSQQIVKLYVTQFGFNVSVLGQVSSGVGLLSTERFLHTEHVTQGWQTESSDGSQESTSDLHDRGQGFTSQGQMTLVQQQGWISVFLNLVGEGFFTTWSQTDDFVEVSLQFNTTWSSLTFRQLVNNTLNFDGGFQGQFLGRSGLGQVASEHGLDVTGTVSQGDESQTLLNSQTMNPTLDQHSGFQVVLNFSQLDLLGLWQ